MHVFTVLYTACTTGLPPAESLLLYRDVTELDDSPECLLDTSLILSRAVAKRRNVRPTCGADAFPVCANFIAAGAKSCDEDYCELCPEAHTCDHTCGLPCAGGIGGPPGSAGDGGHRLRLLAELGGWSSALDNATGTCPLEDLHNRLDEIDAACCTIEDVCAGGVPSSCPYHCGRIWTAFEDECWSLMSSFQFVDDSALNPYETFSNKVRILTFEL